MYKLLILFILTLNSSMSSDFLIFNSTLDNDFEVKKSRWAVDLGLRYIRYKTEAAEFKGKHSNIDPVSNEDAYNLSLELGRDFYLGAGLFFGVRVSGFASDNSFVDEGNAGEDLDYIVSKKKENFVMLGTEVSASIGYLFENKSLHIMPFAEFGVGSGRARVKKTYDDKGIVSDPVDPTIDYDPQNYKYKAKEDFLMSRLSVGVKFLTNYSINSFIRASFVSIDVKDREIEELTASSSVTSPGTEGESNTSVSGSLGMSVTF